jgi:hypothetical protein
MSYDPNHVHEPVEPRHEPVEPRHEPSTGWTGYAAVKYGFMFLIVVALLYFAAVYAIPALTD